MRIFSEHSLEFVDETLIYNAVEDLLYLNNLWVEYLLSKKLWKNGPILSWLYFSKETPWRVFD